MKSASVVVVPMALGTTAPEAQEVVTAAVRIGSALARAGARDVDDVGIVGVDVLGLDPQLLPHRRELVGEEHVARLGQPVDELEARVGFDVDPDALLAPVGVLEQDVHVAQHRHDAARGQAPHGVTTLGVLDLDDLGTPVGQDGGGGRHEGVLGDLKDADTFHDVGQRNSSISPRRIVTDSPRPG